MKRKLFFLTLVIVVAVVSIALMRAGSAGAGLDATAASPNPAMLSGGRYQLTDMTLDYTQDNASPETDVASGGGYHLQVLDSPRLTGNGCCCLYLPCVFR